jgi:hypothetical protein
MSTQHTQGLLVASEPSDTLHAIRDTKGRVVADVGYSGTNAGDIANARRIVACWNACDGIDTQYLESYGLPDFAQKISDLAAQRDELLADLEDAVSTQPADSPIKWVLRARATTAKLRGGTAQAQEQTPEDWFEVLTTESRKTAQTAEPQSLEIVHLPADDTEGGLL